MADFTTITQTFDLPIMAALQGSGSVFLDRAMVLIAEPYTWIPLYLSLAYMVISNSTTMRQVLLTVGFALLAVGITALTVDQMIKPSFMRLRPIYDNTIGFQIDTVGNFYGGAYGFISGHAANTMAIAMFVSLVVRNRLLTTVLLVWSLLNCYTRIYLGVHYPSDVLCGILWGLAVASIVYLAYAYANRRRVHSVSFISRKFTDTGYSRSDIHIVVIVLIVTLILVLTRSLFEL